LIWQLIRKIEEGYFGFIAVDGPQGSPHQAKPGMIYIAKKTKATIIPLSIEAQRGIVLRRRWDKHFIPLPFNKITLFIGKPIQKKAGDSLTKMS
ncbi:hypothetical protein H5U35_07005, partial [Candidatus Aerophobetes bacterium]|nr:hypothetical protein [Candidatus Aerophobetes bacterium]